MRTKQFKLGPMENFSYVIWDEATRDAAVIDPAWQPQKLADFIKKEDLTLHCVLLTHAHPDHVNGVTYFTSGRKDIPVYLHDADRHMLEQPPAGLKPAEDGAKIEAGAVRVGVMHTPGHTPGSVCYLSGGDVFTGDTLFIGECGRVDLPGSSAESLYESFVKLAGLPDEDIVYPGHSYNGDTSTFGVQKEYNLYLKLARLGRRADFLRAVS
jgi:glyoxylase-like metal-dependent hydrolase (beta-lactamase superfamily II)